jgi:2-methylcitrate dehydratase PrpD
LTAVLAAAVTPSSRIPADVRARAAKILVDTLAVAIAGRSDPFCRAYVASTVEASASGTASTVAYDRGVMPEIAAMANALPTTVLQIDEGHRVSGSHPAIQVVPAALAVAEDVDATGVQLLTGIVRGYEVAASLGMALAPMRAGVHPNGTSGTIGAGVAAGSLWGMQREGMASVVAGLASLPIVPRLRAAYEGNTVLHLFAAYGAMVAVATARAVLAGLTASPASLDDHFLPNLGGRAVAGREDFQTLSAYFKFYPVCAHAHTSIEALEEILAAGDISADKIERIEVRAYEAAAQLADPAPTSDLGARFSIPFSLARRAVAGTLDNRALTRADLSDEATLDLARRVTVIRDDELSRRYPASRPVRLAVVLRDGAQLVAHRDLPRGDSDRPETEDAWRVKIRALIGAHAGQLLEFVDRPPDDWSARELGLVLRRWVTAP